MSAAINELYGTKCGLCRRAARPEVRRHSTGPASGPAALHVHPLGLPWRLLLLLRRWLLLLLWWGLLTHGILVRLLVQLLVQLLLLLLRLRLLLRWRLLWWLLLLLLHHHLLPLEPRKLVLLLLGESSARVLAAIVDAHVVHRE